MTPSPDAHLESALKWLDRTQLSRRRLIEKMGRAGWDEAESHRVAERLAAMGVVDDEAMGRALIEEIQSRKPAGPALLRARLLQRGLDDALVERLILEITERSDADPVADAAALARKRLRSLVRFTPAVKKRRLWSLLARRGFDGDTIEQALGNLSELRDVGDDF